MERRDGFTLIELAVALFVLTAGVIASALIFVRASESLAGGKDRRVALSVASSFVEEIRTRPYAEVCLRSVPPSSADTRDPNVNVSFDPARSSWTYRYEPGRPAEVLVVQSCPSTGIANEPPPEFPPGPIRGTVYQYVTWVDDPATAGNGDLKRVVVIARWENPSGGGATDQVRVETFVTPQ